MGETEGCNIWRHRDPHAAALSSGGEHLAATAWHGSFVADGYHDGRLENQTTGFSSVLTPAVADRMAPCSIIRSRLCWVVECHSTRDGGRESAAGKGSSD